MADAASHIFCIDGFLSSQIVLAAASHQPDETQQAAALCINLNRLSLKRLQEIKLTADDSESIVSALLVAQATTSFESAVLLACMGIEGEARSLVRRCIDSAITCYALAKCPELVLEHFKADRYKHYKSLANELPRSLELPDDHALRVYLKRILESLEEMPSGRFDLSQLAEKAGIKEVYDTIFRFLSADASHPTLDSLQKVAARDQETGNIVGISIIPRHDGMGTTLLIAAISQLVAIKALQIIHPDPDIEEMVTGYTDLARNIWKMAYPEWGNAFGKSS